MYRHMGQRQKGKPWKFRFIISEKILRLELCTTQFNVSVSTYNLQSRKPKQSMSRMKLS